MEVDVRPDADGKSVILYFQDIELREFYKEELLNEYLNMVDSILKSFSKTKHYKDIFFLWERSKPQEMRLIKKSPEELSEKDIETLRKLYFLFENTLKKGLSGLNEGISEF